MFGRVANFVDRVDVLARIEILIPISHYLQIAYPQAL